MTDRDETPLSQQAKARARRRAEALRSNLRRRKQQGPVAPASDVAEPPEPDSADPPSSPLT